MWPPRGETNLAVIHHVADRNGLPHSDTRSIFGRRSRNPSLGGYSTRINRVTTWVKLPAPNFGSHSFDRELVNGNDSEEETRIAIVARKMCRHWRRSLLEITVGGTLSTRSWFAASRPIMILSRSKDASKSRLAIVVALPQGLAPNGTANLTLAADRAARGGNT